VGGYQRAGQLAIDDERLFALDSIEDFDQLQSIVLAQRHQVDGLKAQTVSLGGSPNEREEFTEFAR
jgi:hypothetical protein